MNAYHFLKGFFEGLKISIDEEKLYNGINDIGLMYVGPLNQLMEELKKSNGAPNQRVWMMMHEVSHSFLEGGQILIAKGAITDS